MSQLEFQLEFVDGQLVGSGIPLPLAKQVAALAAAGDLEAAKRLLANDGKALRVLLRCREVSLGKH